MPAALIHKMPEGDGQPWEKACVNAVLPKQELAGIRDVEALEKAGDVDLASRPLFRKTVPAQTVDVKPQPALDKRDIITIRLNYPWSYARPQYGKPSRERMAGFGKWSIRPQHRCQAIASVGVARLYREVG
jgi:hypothetical protein